MYTSIYCTSILLTKVLAIFNFFQPYLFDFIRLLIGGELDYLHILYVTVRSSLVTFEGTFYCLLTTLCDNYSTIIIPKVLARISVDYNKKTTKILRIEDITRIKAYCVYFVNYYTYG